jgi:hypothetical protein
MERITLSKGERVFFSIVSAVFFIGMYASVYYGFCLVDACVELPSVKDVLILSTYMLTGAILFVFGCVLALAAIFGSFLSPE